MILAIYMVTATSNVTHFSKLRALPQTVLATMEGIAQQCGMVSLVLLGGVDPENPQTVQTMV